MSTNACKCLRLISSLCGAGPVSPQTAALVDTATHAIYTCGRLSLECGALPTQCAVRAIQALCMPSHLQQHASSLSPKLTPGYALTCCCAVCMPHLIETSNSIHMN
jgi:hypothetical protein